MDKRTLKIQDLADQNQSFLLLDEQKCVIWISHGLRKDLLLAGLESRALLGRNLNDFRESVACGKVSLSRFPKKPREDLSQIELCGQDFFIAEMNLGHRL